MVSTKLFMMLSTKLVFIMLSTILGFDIEDLLGIGCVRETWKLPSNSLRSPRERTVGPKPARRRLRVCRPCGHVYVCRGTLSYCVCGLRASPGVGKPSRRKGRRRCDSHRRDEAELFLHFTNSRTQRINATNSVQQNSGSLQWHEDVSLFDRSVCSMFRYICSMFRHIMIYDCLYVLLILLLQNTWRSQICA